MRIVRALTAQTVFGSSSSCPAENDPAAAASASHATLRASIAYSGDSCCGCSSCSAAFSWQLPNSKHACCLQHHMTEGSAAEAASLAGVLRCLRKLLPRKQATWHVPLQQRNCWPYCAPYR